MALGAPRERARRTGGTQRTLLKRVGRLDDVGQRGRRTNARRVLRVTDGSLRYESTLLVGARVAAVDARILELTQPLRLFRGRGWGYDWGQGWGWGRGWGWICMGLGVRLGWGLGWGHLGVV